MNTLNSGDIGKGVEVVVAPPALYLDTVQKTLRPDVAVAAQASALCLWCVGVFPLAGGLTSHLVCVSWFPTGRMDDRQRCVHR